ncbi:Uncharacterised protein [Mycobacteroides abscessus subsp. abscessus]|nr:Uncharacterised protein [Mycobacteroides abscessus subsp. abscessus]
MSGLASDLILQPPCGGVCRAAPTLVLLLAPESPVGLALRAKPRWPAITPLGPADRTSTPVR